MAVPAVRKISETIVDFGDPLIQQLDSDQPYEVVRSMPIRLTPNDTTHGGYGFAGVVG